MKPYSLIIDIDPLPESLLALKDELPETVYDAMQDVVEPRAIQLVREQIYDVDAIAEQDFLDSWRGLTEFVGQSGSRVHTHIFSEDKREKVETIEWGRPKDAKFAPPPAIRHWIDVVGLQPTDASTTKDQLAFLINRHIHEDGIKGRFPIETARVILEGEASDLVHDYIDRHLKI
jgi:hypothetical protein